MLGNYKATTNLISKTSGKGIANQIITQFENGETLTSYGVLVGVMINGKVYLTPKHCFSATTSKYVGQWCGLTKDERLWGLNNGTIELIEN